MYRLAGLGQGVMAQPIEPAHLDVPLQQRLARADDHAAGRRIDPHHIKRLAFGNAKAAALADGVVNDALVVAQHAAIEMHDVARLQRHPAAACE